MDEPKYAYLVRRMQRVSLLRRIWGRNTVMDLDLHMQQMPILEYIMENDGCNQCEIAEALNVSAQSVALSTKRMQNAGLVVKDVDANNLRRNKLSITPKGRELTRECRNRLDNLDGRMLDGLDSDELEAFCNILDKMIANLTSDELDGLSMDELRNIVCNRDHNNNKKEKQEEKE